MKQLARVEKKITYKNQSKFVIKIAVARFHKFYVSTGKDQPAKD